MLVNIIIPVYNTDTNFLKECINSIEFQTFKNWKLIIVNDASSEKETVDFLNSIKKNNIDIKHLDKNAGEMNARFYGIKFIDEDCEYIAFMDSDDIMLPSRIAKQLSFLQSNPKIDVVGSQMQMFYDPSEICIESPEDLPPRLSFTSHPINVNNYIFIKHWCINNPSSFMRREVFNDFDPDKINELQHLLSLNKNRFGDYIFYAILVKNGFQIRNLDEILLLYRCSKNQVSKIKITNQALTHKNLRYKIFFETWKETPRYRKCLAGDHLYFDSARHNIGKYVTDLLTPEHKVLDLGCGVLRVGLPIIKYLDANNYYGFDISEHRLLEAKQEVSDNNLLSKNPKLTHEWSDINLKFDFIWCYQLFIHLDDEILDDVLYKISSSLKNDGVCIASINISDKYEDNARWLEYPFVCRPYSFYEERLRCHDLKFEKVANWGVDSPEDSGERLIKITRI